MKFSDVKKFYEGMPVMIGSYTMKYENGKNRALYPTDTFSYIMMSYLLKHSEKMMDERLGFENHGNAAA